MANVVVLDGNNRFIRYVHPAEARKMLAADTAFVYSKDPFIIKTSEQRGSLLEPLVLSNKDAMTVKNFTEYFKQERDIYVQNISNCQVSVQFEVGPGHTESYLFTNTRDPVNLTQEIPFNAIKASMDMRKMLNRQPPALKLVAEEEYKAYYAKAAETRGLATPDAAIAEAASRRTSTQHHVPVDDDSAPVEKVAKKEAPVASGPSMETEEDINPRILNLCLQVHPRLDDTEKITAQTFLSELDSAGELKLLDWEYVLAHGYYKTVKNLAKKKIAELASSEETDAAPTAAPPATKAKKASVKKMEASK